MQMCTLPMGLSYFEALHVDVLPLASLVFRLFATRRSKMTASLY